MNNRIITPGGIHEGGNPPASAAGTRVLEVPVITSVVTIIDRERILEESGVVIPLVSPPVSTCGEALETEGTSREDGLTIQRPPTDSEKRHAKNRKRKARKRRVVEAHRNPLGASASHSEAATYKRPRSAEVTPTNAIDADVVMTAPSSNGRRKKRRKTSGKAASGPLTGGVDDAATSKSASFINTPGRVASAGIAGSATRSTLGVTVGGGSLQSTSPSPAINSKSVPAMSAMEEELDTRPSTSKGLRARPSYSEKVVGSLPVAVICRRGTVPGMTDAELRHCKRHLMKRVIASGPEANARGFEMKDGTIRVQCSSQANFHWIVTESKRIPALGKSLFTACGEEPEPMRKVIGWFPDPDLETAHVLPAIRAQNPGIDTTSWRILSHTRGRNWDNKEGSTLCVRMNQKSVDLLGSLYANRLSLFFGKIVFNILPK